MTFTVEKLEIFIVILVRIVAFVSTAPIFGIKSVPQRAKILISVGITIVTFFTVSLDSLTYQGVIGYAILVLKEAIVGASIGFFANIATYVLSFSGQLVDMNIGFSMMSEFDPISNQQVTITSNIFMYGVLLIMICSNMHLYILRAIVDSFQIIPVGSVNINVGLYALMTDFLTQYMILGFRIILPIFGSILIANTILAILAKIAPQMNMFVIGHQLKILVGFFVLAIIIQFLPQITDAVFNLIIEMLKKVTGYFVPV